FINNINILIYSKSIEKNYRAIKQAHNRYIEWVRKYRAVFTLDKYHLIYFIKACKFINIKAIVNI
ncbi:uncharacterized protein BDZ99DRAFT_395327, partial [Mytilinidion resinicola]